MFSAITSDGTVYVSGRIPHPKELQFFCLYPDCKAPVTHVNRSLRGICIPVAEHFRHLPKYKKHPERQFTWQKGNIMDILLDDFDCETDKPFTDQQGLDFLVDLYLPKEQTAVYIESDSFSFQDFHNQVRSLSSQDIATLLILSAYGKENKNGNYFRNADRKKSPKDLKLIKGNEREVYDLLSFNVYFDHDTQTFISTQFEDYQEEVEQFFYSHEEGKAVSTGERFLKTFADFKLPINTLYFEHFNIKPIRLENGLYIPWLTGKESQRMKTTVKAIDTNINPTILENLRAIESKRREQLTLFQ